MFEKYQHAQSTGLLSPGRRNFSLKSVRIPAKKLLASGQNSSPLVILLFFKQGLGPLSLSLPLTANAQGQTMWTLPEKRLFRSYLRQAKSPKGEQNYFRPTAYLCPKPGKSPSCIPQEIYCLFSTHIGPLLGSGAFFPSYTPPVNAPNDIKLLNRSW